MSDIINTMLLEEAYEILVHGNQESKDIVSYWLAVNDLDGLYEAIRGLPEEEQPHYLCGKIICECDDLRGASFI